MAALAMAFDEGADLPLGPGPGVHEGKLAAGLTVKSPIELPLLFGHVQVGYCCVGSSSQQSGLNAINIWKGNVGDARVKIETESGVVQARLGDPWTTWKITKTTPEVRPTTLDDVPLAPRVVRGWRDYTQSSLFRHFVVGVQAVRPGDTVLVEVDSAGHATRTWLGGRAAFREHAQSMATQQLTLSVGLGAFALALVALGIS